MRKRPPFGDYVAWGAVAGLFGGIGVGMGIAAMMLPSDYAFAQPLQALVSMLGGGLVGLLFGVFIAWPICTLISAVVGRLFGWTRLHAGITGAVLALTLSLTLQQGEPVILRSVFLSLFFLMFGTGVAVFSYQLANPKFARRNR